MRSGVVTAISIVGLGLMRWPLGLASVSAAEPETPRAGPSLTWQAPPACPDGEAVSERIEAVVGGELSEYGKGWQARGRVSRGSQAWQLVLQLREPGRALEAAPLERVLTAPRCEDLVEAAAVAIAIALGDARDQAADSRKPAAAVEAAASMGPPENGTADFDQPSLEVAPGAPHRLGLGGSLDAVLDSGSVGGPALGGSLGLGGWLGPLGAGAYGTWLPAHRKDIAPQQGAEFSLWLGGVRGCYQLFGGAGNLGLAPCVGFEIGQLRADSHGLREGASTRDTWLAPSVGLALQAKVLGPLAANSRLDLVLPLGRQTYRVDLVQPVYEIPALLLRWSLGVSAVWEPNRGL
jgi:hypothetical protein